MLFSVITVTKNNPAGFERTRHSMHSQTCQDYEWIVIDGALEADNGIYDAMNKGLDRARGRYVIFMNAGDTFASPQTLAIIAQADGADFIYGDALEDGHLKPARHDIRLGMITHHQAIIYRRDCIGGLRYDQTYSIAADYKFTLMFLMHAQTCRYMPHALCDFEPGGLSQVRTKLGRRQQATIRKDLGIHVSFLQTKQAVAQYLKIWIPGAYWFMRARRSSGTLADMPHIPPVPIADNPVHHHDGAMSHPQAAPKTG